MKCCGEADFARFFAMDLVLVLVGFEGEVGEERRTPLRAALEARLAF